MFLIGEAVAVFSSPVPYSPKSSSDSYLKRQYQNRSVPMAWACLSAVSSTTKPLLLVAPPTTSAATPLSSSPILPHKWSSSSSPVFGFGRLVYSRSKRERHVVRMAPDEEKLTRRSPLDFPLEWEKPKPGRRPDIFPQFSPMKAPVPPPLPYDPPGEDEEEDEEDEEKKEEEEEEGEGGEDENPEKEDKPSLPESQ